MKITTFLRSNYINNLRSNMLKQQINTSNKFLENFQINNDKPLTLFGMPHNVKLPKAFNITKFKKSDLFMRKIEQTDLKLAKKFISIYKRDPYILEIEDLNLQLNKVKEVNENLLKKIKKNDNFTTEVEEATKNIKAARINNNNTQQSDINYELLSKLLREGFDIFFSKQKFICKEIRLSSLPTPGQIGPWLNKQIKRQHLEEFDQLYIAYIYHHIYLKRVLNFNKDIDRAVFLCCFNFF